MKRRSERIRDALRTQLWPVPAIAVVLSVGLGIFLPRLDAAVDDSLLASMSPQEVRAAMRSLGYRTQGDLAAAIGVSRSTVSLWLEGKVGVPRPVAMLLRMLIAAQRRPF